MEYVNGLVSVIIPTFGRSENICTTLDSVFAQTYPKIEIIVVDDNGFGCDNQKYTQDNIVKYNDRNYKLIYLPLEKNSGGSFARNAGAKIAQGEYLCFLDDDDEFLPEKVSKQVAILLHNADYIGCYCSHIRRFTDLNIENPYISTHSGDLLYRLLMFKIDTCSGSSLMVYHWVFDKIGGFTPDMKRMQDYEFIARVAFVGQIGVVSDPVLIINVHKGSYNIKNLNGRLQIRKRYLEIVSPLFVKLTHNQIANVIAILQVQNIVDAIKFKRFDRAASLFFNSKHISKTVFFLIKRLLMRI